MLRMGGEAMYTEYIFENKKYEVALRDLKATLFDIVTTENAKVGKLREKTEQTKGGEHHKELEELCQRQDGCLREIISLTSQLEGALQRVDTCSRDLKQIENNDIAQIVARVHDGNHEVMASKETYPQEFISEDVYQSGGVSNTMNQEVSVEVESASHNNLMTGDTSDVQVANSVSQVNDEMSMNIKDEGDAMAVEAEKNATDSDNVSETPTDVVMTYNDDLSTVESENEKNMQIEETKEEVSSSTNENVEVSNGEASIPSVEESVPVSEETSEKKDSSVETVVIPEDTAEKVSESAEVISQPETVVAEEKQESTPLIIPVINSGETSEPVLTPVSTEEAPVASGIPVIVETPAAQETNESSSKEVVAEATTEETVENEQVSGDNAQNNDQPITQPDDKNVGFIHFKKRSTDTPKAIMISAKQALNLRSSCETKEALLSAKGLFGSKELSASDLVDDVLSAKQAQIEQMMQQANQLYAEGKVEAAQRMYNQISILNKELQKESVGISK